MARMNEFVFFELARPGDEALQAILSEGVPALLRYGDRYPVDEDTDKTIDGFAEQNLPARMRGNGVSRGSSVIARPDNPKIHYRASNKEIVPVFSLEVDQDGCVVAPRHILTEYSRQHMYSRLKEYWGNTMPLGEFMLEATFTEVGEKKEYYAWVMAGEIYVPEVLVKPESIINVKVLP